MVSIEIAWSFSELIEYTFETVAIVPSITVVVVCEMRKLTGLNVPQSKGQCVCLAIDLLRYGIQWGLNDAHTIFNLYNPCVFLFLIQTSIFTRQYPTPCLPYLCKLFSCSSCSNLICTSFLIISGY